MKYIVVNFKTNKNSITLHEYFDLLNKMWVKNNKWFKKTFFIINHLYLLNLISHYQQFNFGVQSFNVISNGSFTSGVSLEQLKDEGIKNYLIGHSEEYKYFFETIEKTNEKLLKLSELNLKIFLCFGNDNKIDDLNKLVLYLMNKLNALLLNVNVNNFKKIILAYEPIYTIGTGYSMEPFLINEVILELKKNLFIKYNYEFEILYGGSVNINNASTILNLTSVDGVLVGRASLDVVEIGNIIKLNDYEK